MPNTYTTEQFIEISTKMHNGKYSYEKAVYIAYDALISIFCPYHGYFEQRAALHMKGAGCRLCQNELSALRQRRTTPEFIRIATELHKGFYTYEAVEYVNNNTKVKITCPEHGIFEQLPSNHLSGHGCLKCDGQGLDTETFISKSQIKHNFKYDYSRVNYQLSQIKVEILCPIHGSFMQTPNSHLGGNGCPYCSGKIVFPENFFKDCRISHGETYDYSKVEFRLLSSKILVICPEHGPFEIRAENHRRGKGCPKCPNNQCSVKENEWLDYLNIPWEDRRVRVNLNESFIVADGFDQLTNTVHEFWGDFWHGNPNVYDASEYNRKVGKTFGELYDLTQSKIQRIKSSGLNLNHIWESDWDNLKKSLH